MVRSAFLVAIVTATLALGSAAIAQPGQLQPPKGLALAERLEKPVTFDYQGARLKVVIENLKETMLIPIVVDIKKLEENAISLETRISGKSSGGPAIDDINELLRSARLSGEIRLDVFYISPLRGQKQFPICRFYRLPKGADTADLIKRLTSKIAAATWRDAGGTGEIVQVAPTVVAIYQIPETQREIQRKFGKELSPVSAPLDKIAALSPTKGPNPISAISQVMRLSNSADYPETPFREALVDWAKNTKVKLAFDDVSIKAAGINPGTPLSVNFKSMPAESVLTLMLEGFDLDWTLDGEQVFVTVPKIAAANDLTITYDTHGLVPPSDNDTLVRAIQHTIRPATWDSAGGAGKITTAKESLKIQQTVKAHREIETWLADLRTALKPEADKK
jgi:hypothetical protein